MTWVLGWPFYDDDAIEAAYASAGESDDSDLPEDRMDVEELSSQVDVVEQSFMQNFSYTKSFSFRKSGCTIDLQVSDAFMPGAVMS